MMFDLPPSGFAALARRGMRTSLRYRVPPMPFSLSVSDAANLVNIDSRHPGGARSAACQRTRGKVFNSLMWTLNGFRCSTLFGRR